MGKPRKIKGTEELEKKWEEYKYWCDHQEVLTHEFSNKNSEFVTATLTRSITYTIEGFCAWLGLARSKFYQTYGNDDDYGDIITRMREECEMDARRKFELQMIPDKLAPLWMSRHGYTTKTENNIESQTGNVIILAEATDGEP